MASNMPWSGMLAGLAQRASLTKPLPPGGPQLPPGTPPPGGVNLPQFPPTQPAPAPGGGGEEPPWIQRARLQRKQRGGMGAPQAPQPPRPQMPKAPQQNPAGPYGGIMGGQDLRQQKLQNVNTLPAPMTPGKQTDPGDVFGKIPGGYGGY